MEEINPHDLTLAFGGDSTILQYIIDDSAAVIHLPDLKNRCLPCLFQPRRLALLYHTWLCLLSCTVLRLLSLHK
jgi:hypothetical protein